MKKTVKGFIPVRRVDDLDFTKRPHISVQFNIDGCDKLKIMGYKLIPCTITYEVPAKSKRI